MRHLKVYDFGGKLILNEYVGLIGTNAQFRELVRVLLPKMGGYYAEFKYGNTRRWHTVYNPKGGAR